MNSIKFSESITIDCSPSFAFDYTQDYDHRLSWDTFLSKAELINGALQAGPGVKAYCVAHNGLGMETEYVSFRRPDVTAIKMTKGPFFFRSFLGSWRFKAIGSATEVTFLYSFQLIFPLNLLKSVVKKTLQNNVKQRLADLKDNIEQIKHQYTSL